MLAGADRFYCTGERQVFLCIPLHILCNKFPFRFFLIVPVFLQTRVFRVAQFCLLIYIKNERRADMKRDKDKKTAEDKKIKPHHHARDHAQKKGPLKKDPLKPLPHPHEPNLTDFDPDKAIINPDEAKRI